MPTARKLSILFNQASTIVSEVVNSFHDFLAHLFHGTLRCFMFYSSRIWCNASLPRFETGTNCSIRRHDMMMAGLVPDRSDEIY
jgi:hypothetical protein